MGMLAVKGRLKKTFAPCCVGQGTRGKGYRTDGGTWHFLCLSIQWQGLLGSFCLVVGPGVRGGAPEKNY